MTQPLRRGDIVLTAFPFTDLTTTKVRPALIVSSEPIGRDMVVAFISSVRPEPMEGTELEVDPSRDHVTGLKKTSFGWMSGTRPPR